MTPHFIQGISKIAKDYGYTNPLFLEEVDQWAKDQPEPPLIYWNLDMTELLEDK